MQAAIDFEKSRHLMIEQQIRTWEVLDQDVLDLLARVKRENFVPPHARALAFVDMEIPLGHGECMMQPKLEARILQELQLKTTDRVYEVGTGSGYLTALLATATAHVTTAEIEPDLAEMGRANIKRAGLPNVAHITGDSARGPLASEDFDVIVLAGSTPVLPKRFLDRLKPGGRLFAVVGDLPIMKAMLYRKNMDGNVGGVELFETVLKPLVNCEQKSKFVL